MSDYFKIVYLFVAALFIVLEGPMYHRWHGGGRSEDIIEQVKQTLLNTLGSVIGWTCAGYLIFYRFNGGLSSFNPHLSDLVIFLIGFYGVVGQLPNVIINKLKLSR